jgi:hypothetical protein
LYIQNININGIVVLFASPETKRWSVSKVIKYSFLSIGFFMETWSNEEFIAVEKWNFPRKLCSSHSKENLTNFSNCFKSFGVWNKKPWEINRIEMFGRQSRFEFTKYKDMILMRNIEMAKKLDRFSFDFDMYNNLSNHFISTEYDVTNRVVYTKYISQFLFDVIMNKLQTETIDSLKRILQGVPHTFRPRVFETIVRKSFLGGFYKQVRFHSEKRTRIVSFPEIYYPNWFYSQVRCHVQMLYENIQFNKLLGATRITKPTYFVPGTHRTYGFDNILVFPGNENNCHVLFVQTTTNPYHDVMLGGFFGMLWFLVTMSYTMGCKVIPWFAFFVTIENFSNFQAAKVDYLKCYSNTCNQ